EVHDLYSRPRCAAVLVPQREDDREARLRVSPVVLEEIALDEYPAGILELEQVLDCPGDTRERRIAHLPAQGFGDVVAANLDVGGREIPDDRVASPEQQILAGGFQVVVVDLERAGAGPPG